MAVPEEGSSPTRKNNGGMGLRGVLAAAFGALLSGSLFKGGVITELTRQSKYLIGIYNLINQSNYVVMSVLHRSGSAAAETCAVCDGGASKSNFV